MVATRAPLASAAMLDKTTTSSRDCRTCMIVLVVVLYRRTNVKRLASYDARGEAKRRILVEPRRRATKDTHQPYT